MPTIVNPYRPQTPTLADTITRVGNTMYGPMALQAEAVRQRTQGLARQNQYLPLYADAAARGDMENALRYGALAGVKGADVADYGRVGAISRAPTINDPGVTRGMLFNAPYSATPEGFNAAQANDLAKTRMAVDRAAKTQEAIADNTPVNVIDPTVPSGYRTVSRAEAISSGLPQVLPATDVEGLGKLKVLNAGSQGMTPEQLKAAGALPPADKTYNYNVVDPTGAVLSRGITLDNGKTDANTGQPITGGQLVLLSPGNAGPAYTGLQKSVQGKVQNNDLALARLHQVGEYARGLISPDRVGLPGYVKAAAQDATQTASGFAQAFGYNGLNDVLADIQKRASAGGFDPKMLAGLFQFDPKLPQLDSAYYALTMVGADALAGGVNRASDKDIKIIRGMLGNPNDLFANPDQLNAKLDAINEVINRIHGVNAAAGASIPNHPAAGAATATQRLRYNPATGQIE
jgi:hypothetical protein